jgi:cytochrome c-type biogenesis protein CcmE
LSRKARRRLAIATLVLVVAFAVAVVWVVLSQGAYYRQVADLGAAVNGKVVKVGGMVLPRSLARHGSTYRFTMRDLTGKASTVTVTYTGPAPDTFGPGVDVVVTGRYDASTASIDADDLQTKCPSKYSASASPAP